MKTKANLVPFSGLVDLEQLQAVMDVGHRAIEARDLYLRKKKERAELERASIDIGPNRRPYALLAAFTWMADTLFGYLMLADVFRQWGLWGMGAAILLSLFMGLLAVYLELVAADIAHTKPHWAVRTVGFISGAMIPPGLFAVLLVLQHALSTNTGAAAAGAATKLWVFGITAIALHFLTFLAGDRVARGLRQWKNDYLIRRATRDQRDAAHRWEKCCKEALILDHRLSHSIEVHNLRNDESQVPAPHYDVITEQLLACIKRLKDAPDVESDLAELPPSAPDQPGTKPN